MTSGGMSRETSRDGRPMVKYGRQEIRGAFPPQQRLRGRPSSERENEKREMTQEGRILVQRKARRFFI